MSGSPADPVTGVAQVATVLSTLEPPVPTWAVHGPTRARDRGRQALRRIASGVTVLTVNLHELRHGMTVSAIVPISRDPVVLGVGLRAQSTFASMVELREMFSVNVLSREQAPIADWFARPGRPPGDAQFAELPWTTDVLTGAPLIGGCLAHLACQVIGRHLVGDHNLFLAEVLSGAPGDGTPLLTFAGRLDRSTVDGRGPSVAREE